MGARYYDTFLNLLPLGSYSHFIKGVIDKMGINPGQSIPDLGSGTGRNDCLMAQKIGSRGKIVGLDISNEMLSQSLLRCREYPNMSFEKQRIELPLAYKQEFGMLPMWASGLDSNFSKQGQRFLRRF